MRGAIARRYPAAVDALTAYATLLATTGVERGLLGPREPARLWARHLANSAVVEELVPQAATVVDVGSGAGLPGIPLALVRPDLRVVLVEPLLRRSVFLTGAVALLGLGDRVEVRRARAEDLGTRPLGGVVTARAVAPLERLVAWALPLAEPSGVMLALKGASAAQELPAAAEALARLGAGTPEIMQCGRGVVDPPTTVVRVARQEHAPPPAAKGRRG